ADQNVARPDPSADADDAGFVEIRQGALADIRNITSELLAPQLGLANFDVVLLDVNRGERVFLDEALADDDRVLEVVAIVGHERDQDVAAQGKLALLHGGAVGDDLALLDALALLGDRLLIEAGSVVAPDELAADGFVGVG